MSNWTDYVSNYALQHGISYGAALKKAGPSYRKKYGTAKKKKAGVVLGAAAKKKKCACKGKKNMKAYKLGKELGGVIGGAAPKGALAALLSGLNANVSVK